LLPKTPKPHAGELIINIINMKALAISLVTLGSQVLGATYTPPTIWPLVHEYTSDQPESFVYTHIVESSVMSQIYVTGHGILASGETGIILQKSNLKTGELLYSLQSGASTAISCAKEIKFASSDIIYFGMSAVDDFQLAFFQTNKDTGVFYEVATLEFESSSIQAANVEVRDFAQTDVDTLFVAVTDKTNSQIGFV